MAKKGSVEITSPVSGAKISSPLVIVCARYSGATERCATVMVGGVKHVVELAGTSGELRENVALLEGENHVEVKIGSASHAIDLTLPKSGNITLDPTEPIHSTPRVLDFNGAFEGVSCPAGVISANGFMQQFAVKGSSGRFAEKVVLKPGDNHVAVQIGEHYATRLVRSSFHPAKLLVTLVWDTNGTDVDLYVVEPSGSAVWYRNKSAAGNLDVDRTQGYGPENYSMGQADKPIAPGDYKVRVHYFSDRNVGRSEWTARVVIDEGSEAQQARTFYGILDVANGGNAEPSATGADWNDVCRIHVDARGRVSLEGA